MRTHALRSLLERCASEYFISQWRKKDLNSSVKLKLKVVRELYKQWYRLIIFFFVWWVNVNSAGRTVSGAPGSVAGAGGSSSGAATPTGSGGSSSVASRFTPGPFPRNVPSRSTFHSGQNRPRNQAATYGGAAGSGMGAADSSGLGPSSRTSFFSKLSSRFSKRWVIPHPVYHS